MRQKPGVGAGRRRGVKRPRQPIPEEQRAQRGPLPFGRPEREQEEQRIAEPDLGQRVLEGEVGLRAVGGAQEDAQRDQQQRAPERVRKEVAEPAAAGHPGRDGVGQRHTHQKRKPGLDGIVQRATGPGDVRLVIGQKAPKGTSGKSFRHARQFQDLSHHQQHDKAAIRVDGQVAVGFFHARASAMLPT